MANRTIKAFSTTERFLHWIHLPVFLVLLLTGLTLYIPQLKSLAIGDSGAFLRLTHRIAAIIFIVLPIFYIIFNPRGLGASLKKMFSWSKDDLGWLKAAPAYYFKGDDSKMPPQDKFNTGQKSFALIVFIGYFVFVITGLIMWFFKTSASSWLLKWSVLLHDICTIGVGGMFLVHFFLSTMHPSMKPSLDAMRFGRVSEEYIKSHHAKWYEEIKGQE